MHHQIKLNRQGLGSACRSLSSALRARLDATILSLLCPHSRLWSSGYRRDWTKGEELPIRPASSIREIAELGEKRALRLLSLPLFVDRVV